MLQENIIIQGDCLIKLKELEDNSVDSIVTDPPYELGFMGKSWDNTGIANNKEMWAECLRVLKPGGHLLAFSGTRTYHRMACAIEDAGFEVRDMIEWVYGSGFPKSRNIGLDVDKRNGVTKNRGKAFVVAGQSGQRDKDTGGDLVPGSNTMGAYVSQNEWNGWGTALKPAHEPICMARKPLAEKTVAENVLKYGTGGINIDESRVGTEERFNAFAGNKDTGFTADDNRTDAGKGLYAGNKEGGTTVTGRFPANLLHDNSEEVRECFPETKTGKAIRSNSGGKTFGGENVKPIMDDLGYDDYGGNASRFFKSIIYQSKAPRSERLLNGFDCAKIEVWKNKDENMEVAVSLVKVILDLLAKNLNTVESGGNITATYPKDFIFTIRTTIKKITELKTWNLLMHSPTKDFIADVFSKKTDGGNLVGYAENSNELMTKIGIFQEKVGLATEDVKNAIYQSLLKISEKDAWQEAQSHHPTHKPIALMEYLIKMVTPKGGIVLDPFAGSGSTLVAAKQNGYKYIGIEMTPEYIPIIEARLKNAVKENTLF